MPIHYDLIRCPYDDCPFEGEDDDEVEDHVDYMISMGDPEHAPEQYRG